MLLSLGQGNQARAVLAAAGPDHRVLRVAQARLELLAGRPETALSRAADPGWARHADRRAQLEMLVVEAVAHHRLDHADAAVNALRRALAGTQTTGSLRPLTAMPRHELTTIANTIPTDTAAPLHESALQTKTDLFPNRVDLIELTDREQAVLDKLAQGLLVHEIAGHLYVSESTIKTHLKALYRKLEATNRRAAVAHARRLGFLTDPEARVS